nr:hypothetical protein [Actinomycetales bacterium]
MLNIFSAVFGLAAIVAIGYVFKRVGWVQASNVGIFSKIILYVTLPALIVTSFNSTVIEPSLFMVTAVAAFAILIQMGVGVFVLERAGGPRERVFALLNAGNYNVGNFAIPFLTTLVGPPAVVTAAMFDMGQGVLVAGIGYATAMAISRGKPVTFAAVVKEAFKNPVMIAYLVMVTLRMLDITLPDGVIEFTARLGGANTFVALFMLGVALELRLNRESYRRAVLHLGVRYAFTIVLSLLVWFVVPLALEFRVPLIMLLWAPIASLAPALTAEAGGDFQLSSFVTAVSTVIGMIMMPIVLVILT